MPATCHHVLCLLRRLPYVHVCSTWRLHLTAYYGHDNRRLASHQSTYPANGADVLFSCNLTHLTPSPLPFLFELAIVLPWFACPKNLKAVSIRAVLPARASPSLAVSAFGFSSDPSGNPGLLLLRHATTLLAHSYLGSPPINLYTANYVILTLLLI